MTERSLRSQRWQVLFNRKERFSQWHFMVCPILTGGRKYAFRSFHVTICLSTNRRKAVGLQESWYSWRINETRLFGTYRHLTVFFFFFWIPMTQEFLWILGRKQGRETPDCLVLTLTIMMWLYTLHCKRYGGDRSPLSHVQERFP